MDPLENISVSAISYQDRRGNRHNNLRNGEILEINNERVLFLQDVHELHVERDFKCPRNRKRQVSSLSLEFTRNKMMKTFEQDDEANERVRFGEIFPMIEDADKTRR